MGLLDCTARPGVDDLLCAVDIGTVSTRLMVARTDPAGRVERLEGEARITDLGEGVDATGLLCQQAVSRTLGTVGDYVARVKDHARRAGRPLPVAVTMTSAARDAANAGDLTEGLEAMGLKPQVIAGTVEASLSLLGVTADFQGQNLMVADVGGGSTELTCGGLMADGSLAVGACGSYDVGCRRLAERFSMAEQAADDRQVAAARSWVTEVLAPRFEHRVGLPNLLVCVGGTATSLVAVANGLDPYDPAFVHLHPMGRKTVHELAERLPRLSLTQRAELPGLQPKRAAVIGAGAIVLDVLLELGGWDGYTASESDSLFGLVACMDARQKGLRPPFGWAPQTAFIA